jgi:hypothetical protein
MQLGGGLGGTKACPGQQSQAQINRHGIQRVNRLRQFHPKGFAGIETPGASDQPLSQVAANSSSAFPAGGAE